MLIQSKKGFSLLEIVITILVITILATIVVEKLDKDAVLKSKSLKIQETVNAVQKKILVFFRDTGFFPSKISELWRNEDENGDPIPNWAGPYIEPDRLKGDQLAFEDYIFKAECIEGEEGEFNLIVENIPPALARFYDKHFDNGDINTGKVVYLSDAKELKIHLFDAQDVETKYIFCR